MNPYQVEVHDGLTDEVDLPVEPGVHWALAEEGLRVDLVQRLLEVALGAPRCCARSVDQGDGQALEVALTEVRRVRDLGLRRDGLAEVEAEHGSTDVPHGEGIVGDVADEWGDLEAILLEEEPVLDGLGAIVAFSEVRDGLEAGRVVIGGKRRK